MGVGREKGEGRAGVGGLEGGCGMRQWEQCKSMWEEELQS